MTVTIRREKSHRECEMFEGYKEKQIKAFRHVAVEKKDAVGKECTCIVL